MPDVEPIAKIAKLAKAAGVLRPRDLDAHGIARQYLRLAEQRGLVVRSGRGLYTPAEAAITEFHSFAEAAKRIPRGVITRSGFEAVQFQRVIDGFQNGGLLRFGQGLDALQPPQNPSAGLSGVGAVALLGRHQQSVTSGFVGYIKKDPNPPIALNPSRPSPIDPIASRFPLMFLPS